MPMRPRVAVSGRVSKELVTAFLPHIILPLVRRRIITARELDDPKALWGLVVKYVRIGTREMRYSRAIDDCFLEQSVGFWRRGERLMAIVLYATAIEQYLNQMYQAILIALGWSKSHATSLLREVNIDAKVGWMFEAFTKQRFPVRLAQRLRTVFSVRNAIVHFKGEPGHPERNDDSYSKVEAQLRGLRRMSLSRDFRLLDEACVAALLSADPDRDLVSRTVKVINQLRAKTKGGGT
jgi:hypothetical protein